MLNEYIEHMNKLSADRRQWRDNLLKASDWTQVADAPVDKEAWAVYRQALRDVTQQEGFPMRVEWPVPPTQGNSQEQQA